MLLFYLLLLLFQQDFLVFIKYENNSLCYASKNMVYLFSK
ncbi:hypothetical protein SALWKB12_2023 [Snodgrassella communis]|nr:hypothetical protein SALWKB12_2023 [Snodgrassella communis]